MYYLKKNVRGAKWTNLAPLKTWLKRKRLKRKCIYKEATGIKSVKSHMFTHIPK